MEHDNSTPQNASGPLSFLTMSKSRAPTHSKAPRAAKAPKAPPWPPRPSALDAEGVVSDDQTYTMYRIETQHAQSAVGGKHRGQMRMLSNHLKAHPALTLDSPDFLQAASLALGFEVTQQHVADLKQHNGAAVGNKASPRFNLPPSVQSDHSGQGASIRTHNTAPTDIHPGSEDIDGHAPHASAQQFHGGVAALHGPASLDMPAHPSINEKQSKKSQKTARKFFWFPFGGSSHGS